MKKAGGQSILEILIALSIIIISVAAAAMLSFGGQIFNTDTDISGRASYLARKELEVARDLARRDFEQLSSTSSTEDGFLKERVVEDIDANTKRVTVAVEKIQLVTLLTNWRNALPLPDPNDDGGAGLSGDWKNPRTLCSVDLGPGNQATDLDVIDKIIYMSATAASEAKPDFFIIDTTDCQSGNAVIVSSLNTGPSLNSIDAAVGYSYAANASSSFQLHILDTNILFNPRLLAEFDLPGVEDAKGLSVFYSAVPTPRVYVGTEKEDNGPEFHIVDVSNPTAPRHLGSFEVNADVNDIYVSGNTAYLATSDSKAELKILDIENPYSIAQIGFWDIAGGTAARSLFAVGSKLYLGQGSRQGGEFHILNVSSPNSVQSLGNAEIGGDVNDIYIRETLAFLATGNSNREFQAWDISNSAQPKLWSFFNFPQMATGIDYENNIVYVSVRSNDALRVITSSGP